MQMVTKFICFREKIFSYFTDEIEPYQLSFYRIGFGLLVMFSLIRFSSNGWIESLYINPSFHFSYFGFSWVKPIGIYTYLIFLICFVAALFVTIGYKYRLSIIILFLSFTYIELMDKTTYLNHYYLVSCISFLMIFLPCSNFFSIDSCNLQKNIPRWTVDSLKVMIIIVYVYAGLAKINTDWLIEAQPLKIWLKSKYHIPLIGETFLQNNYVHYLFSWGGMLYDTFIAFFLLNKRTRLLAFFMVIIFHVMTRVLFPPIGIFPYVMIFSCIIFFDNAVHKKIINKISDLFQFNISHNFKSYFIKKHRFHNLGIYIVGIFLFFQILFPLRSKLYPGELLWTEQGYRFSWRVMLIEKTGYTIFKVVDQKNGNFERIVNSDYLTNFQEKQMSFQPDMIHEFAQFLGDTYKEKGYSNIAVFAESYVTLNGRPSKQFIDPNFNLYKEKNSLKHKKWIIPSNYDIKKLL